MAFQHSNSSGPRPGQPRVPDPSPRLHSKQTHQLVAGTLLASTLPPVLQHQLRAPLHPAMTSCRLSSATDPGSGCTRARSGFWRLLDLNPLSRPEKGRFSHRPFVDLFFLFSCFFHFFFGGAGTKLFFGERRVREGAPEPNFVPALGLSAFFCFTSPAEGWRR